jgi:hypothetical protein
MSKSLDTKVFETKDLGWTIRALRGSHHLGHHCAIEIFGQGWMSQGEAVENSGVR